MSSTGWEKLESPNLERKENAKGWSLLIRSVEWLISVHLDVDQAQV